MTKSHNVPETGTHGEEPALTDWLADQIDEVAGIPSVAAMGDASAITVTHYAN